MSRLQGKLAVITGGSSGIGLAVAQRFTKEGAFVYIRRPFERNRPFPKHVEKREIQPEGDSGANWQFG